MDIFGEYGVRVAGGKVQLVDAVEDSVIRAFDPADALTLLDNLSEHRAQIEALAARKTWAESIACTVTTVTRIVSELPISLTVDSGGIAVKLRTVTDVESIAQAFGEPVMATYDPSWSAYDGLAHRVTFAVVVGDVTYAATDRDENLAKFIADVSEPVSA